MITVLLQPPYSPYFAPVDFFIPQACHLQGTKIWNNCADRTKIAAGKTYYCGRRVFYIFPSMRAPLGEVWDRGSIL